MKKLILPALLMAILIGSCKKSDDNSPAPTEDFNTVKAAVINDFVYKVALPGYAELKTKAATLNTAVTTLNTTTTDANLDAAKLAWKDLRSTWEKCEGFLFGPVDTDEHDPETDTWPVNFVDLDALLADNNNHLELSDIEALTNRALKGYHPIEYVLWGKKTAPQTAATLTANPRQKKYIVSLTAALKKQADQLYDSWIPTGGNYADKLLTAGNGSTEYVTKHDAFTTLLEGFLGICGEVGEGKMKEPFDVAATDAVAGAQLVESPFSGNSATDFKNNITGAYNVYLGKFNESGKGLSNLVALKNLSLDNNIKQKFETAINSFSNITLPYEEAIVTQRIQCQQVMTAIDELADLLDTDLRNFITNNITD